MPDDRTPPPSPKARRAQTQTERDVEGFHARRERDARAAVPEELPDEVTGQYQGEELDRVRARRPTPVRLQLLEKKHDDLDAKVDKIAVDVSKIDGALSVVPKLLDVLEKFGHVGLVATVDVNKAKALDPIEAAKARRALVTQLVGGVIAIALAALAILQVRKC